MRLAAPLLLLVVAASLAAATTVSISADPPLPVPNLVANPGVEAGTDGQPTGWSFTTANPENFQTAWQEGGRSGKCLWMKAKTGVMSGYWNQSVTVPAGRPVLFKGFYRLAAGRMLVYAHSSIALADGRRVAVDERFYRGTMRGHWLVPVFLPPDALGGPDPTAWLPFRLEAKIPEAMTAVSLSLGLYFQTGEVSFDDLWAGPARTDLTVAAHAAAGETLSRVVVKAVGTDKPLADSGALKAGTTSFSTVLKQQPTDAVYEATATQGDGRVIVRRYPEGEVH